MLLDEHEFDAIRELAATEGVTVSEWVRQVLSRARRERPSGDAARKLAAIRAATRHDFPTADIDQTLAETDAGHGG